MSSRPFQAHFGEDKYPIGRFILYRALAVGMSRNDLVHRLGYRPMGPREAGISCSPAELVSGFGNHRPPCYATENHAFMDGQKLFPASWEYTGKFIELCLGHPILSSKGPSVSGSYDQIPYANGTGN
jgi:hypothetical protein